MKIKSKLPKVSTSIFSVMSGMARKHNAINLSQGFPDFGCSDELKALVDKYIREGKNQYASMPGIPELRQVISQKLKALYNADYDLDEITITAGATQAIYTAISTVVNKDDEVIVLEPAYDSYVPSILMNGGTPVFVRLNVEDFSINWDAVEEKISEKTRLIIINSPNNPTGAVITKKDITRLEKIVSDKDIYILSDEVYEHITFDVPHESIAKYQSLRDRSFITFSFGKVLHATGWKLGYCIAPRELTAEFRKMHQFTVFSCNAPMQYAIAEYLQNPEVYLTLPSFFRQKRELVKSLLTDSRFRLLPCDGTYFQIISYEGITDMDDFSFAKELTEKNKIATIPVSAFYHNGYDQKCLRICFAKKDELLKEALSILKEI